MCADISYTSDALHALTIPAKWMKTSFTSPRKAPAFAPLIHPPILSHSLKQAGLVLFDSINVPPAGVIHGYVPTPAGTHVVGPGGDVLEVQARRFPSWVMGFRVLMA